MCQLCIEFPLSLASIVSMVSWVKHRVQRRWLRRKSLSRASCLLSGLCSTEAISRRLVPKGAPNRDASLCHRGVTAVTGAYVVPTAACSVTVSAAPKLAKRESAWRLQFLSR